MRILVVEANRTERLLLSRVLKRCFAAVVLEAETADQGHERLNDSPELILVSGDLAGWNGIDLIRRVRVQGPDPSVPVILVTARSRPEDVLDAIEAGADDVLLKPVQFVALTAKVEQCLRRRQPA